MTPRVSIVVPTRNRLEPLGRALAGIDAQTLHDFEVIVVDDGSTDGTSSWLRHHRPGIHLVTNAQSRGAAAARNLGVSHARGEFIAFLDDDDLWSPTYLEAQVRLLDATPDAWLSYSAHVEVDWRSGRTTVPDTAPLMAYDSPLLALCAEGCIHTMSVVICRRSVFDRIGGLDERLQIVHDLEWYCRILRMGGALARLPEVLVARSTPGGLVAKHREWFAEEYAVLSDILAGDPSESLVRSHRSLLFTRLGLRRGDISFAIARVVEAVWRSPRHVVRIATQKLVRRAVIDQSHQAWSPVQ